ncbi:hypothetical protein Scep_030052 [Stephania cephalantha]|uniref:Methyltransferase type 11 domain-containing protein n=1 Tax=Stephania cephalantha TaxID=152367 RepID=A0AAP0HGI7_9MAGN
MTIASRSCPSLMIGDRRPRRAPLMPKISGSWFWCGNSLNYIGKKSFSVQSTSVIEKKYVHHVYDAIAPHFSSTRFAKWPKVATFLNSLPQGAVVLDVGCGNGKYLGLNPDCSLYWTGFVDAAISIAVLHHLSTENRRKAIEELIRVVHKGGLVLITVCDFKWK